MVQNGSISSIINKISSSHVEPSSILVQFSSILVHK